MTVSVRVCAPSLAQAEAGKILPLEESRRLKELSKMVFVLLRSASTSEPSELNGSCWLLLCRTGAAALCRFYITGSSSQELKTILTPSLFYNEFKNKKITSKVITNGYALQKKKKKKKKKVWHIRGEASKSDRGWEQPSLFGHEGYDCPLTGL